METSKVTTSMTHRNGSHLIGTELTLIEVNSMRFLIMDAPRTNNLHVYLKEMTKYHVTDVVRVCEPTYPTTDLKNAGICVHEMEYKDGSSPSPQLIQTWLQLVESTFFTNPTSGRGAPTTPNKNGTNSTTPSTVPPCIAVHCIAGLGRAPVMVAIALIEFANMDSIEAVRFIRERRRGAINQTQIIYLSSYRKQYKKKHGGVGTDAAKCGCVIM
jgi:protein tyrosine phosphatase type IVA